MTVYHHPRCSTCKKALAWLKAQGIDYKAVDLLEETPTKEEFLQMLEAKSGQLRKLFNTSGQHYRELGLKDRLVEMSQDEALNLLIENGMLVKRPFVIGEKVALLGFREAEWLASLG